MTIVITGANRGIGLELARRYSARGQNVVATQRGTEAPEDLPGVTWVQLDVTDHASFSTLQAALADQPVSLLICNAGVYLDKGEDLETGFAPEIWQRTFKANGMGPFLTVQALLPNLRRTKAAKVAIIGSQMGSNGIANGGSYAYRASKAAAINLASNLATDLKADGIAVGVFHPGWVTTDMGGSGADIDVDTSADGLVARFDDLNISKTGCFEDYAGRVLPF